MEFQAALDDISLEDGMALVEKLYREIDIVELGSPFVWRYPVEVISLFRRRFPSLRILADYKILDGGGFCAGIALDAGADFVSVAGVSLLTNIRSVINSAHSSGKKVLVDMIAVPYENVEQRALDCEDMGADYICVHRGVNESSSQYESLELLRGKIHKSRLAVAGGIDLKTIKEIAPLKPDLVIVGNALIKSDDPLSVLQEMKRIGAEYV